MPGARLKTLLLQDVRSWKPLQWLILWICYITITYNTADYLIFFNADLSNNHICHRMQLSGLAVYMLGKIFIEFLLLERARAARARVHASRWRDWTWVVPASVLSTFGITLIVLTMLDLHFPDDRCYFTLSLPIVVVLFVYNIVVAGALTILFIHLLQRSKQSLRAPSLSHNMDHGTFKHPAQVSSTSRLETPPTSLTQPRPSPNDAKVMIVLQQRTIIAAAILHIPTVVLFVVMLARHNSLPLWVVDVLTVIDSTSTSMHVCHQSASADTGRHLGTERHVLADVIWRPLRTPLGHEDFTTLRQHTTGMMKCLLKVDGGCRGTYMVWPCV